MTSVEITKWVWRTLAMLCGLLALGAWLAQSYMERRTQAGEEVSAIVISADASMVAVANDVTHAVNVWFRHDGKDSWQRFEVPLAEPSFLALSADDRLLASTALASEDIDPKIEKPSPGRVDIFRPEVSMQPVRTVFLEDAVATGLGFIDDNRLAAVLQKSVGIFDLETGRVSSTLPLPLNAYDELRVTDDGRILVYGGDGRGSRVAVWDASEDRMLFDKSDALSRVNHVDVSRDGVWLAAAGRGPGSGGRLRVWNLDNGDELHCDAGIPELADVRIFDDCSGLVTLDSSMNFTIWKLSGDLMRRVARHKLDGYPGHFAITHDGTHATIVTNRGISLWDLESGKLEHMFVDNLQLYAMLRVFRFGKWILLGLAAVIFTWSIRGLLGAMVRRNVPL